MVIACSIDTEYGQECRTISVPTSQINNFDKLNFFVFVKPKECLHPYDYIAWVNFSQLLYFIKIIP